MFAHPAVTPQGEVLTISLGLMDSFSLSHAISRGEGGNCISSVHLLFKKENLFLFLSDSEGHR